MLLRLPPHLKSLFLSLFFPLASVFTAHAQEFRVAGFVYNNERSPMPYATVAVEEASVKVYTAEDGSFTLKLPAGENYLSVSYTGYRTIRRGIVVTGDTDSLKFIMVRESLVIDDVVVTAQAVDSDKGTSAYRVDEQAIRQVQAMNLKDILSLLPGNKIGSADFNAIQQADIRSAVTSNYNNFATAVIVNGVALSNDANMQAPNPTAGMLASYSSVGRGIDLRGISAAGIESVEVITGVPSARYGNLASGTIVVEQKKGVSPFTVSANVNATAYQGAVSKGFDLGAKGGVLNTDLSYVYSNDSPVQRKNYYQSVNFGARWLKQISRRLEWTNIVGVQAFFGFNGQRYEPEERVRNIAEVDTRNVNLSVSGGLELKRFGKLNYTLSGSLDYQYSRYESFGTGPLPLVEALETGTYITGYSAIFFPQEQVMKGLPVNVNAILDWSRPVTLRKWTFNFLTGLQYIYDKNFGEGRSVAGTVAATQGSIGARAAAFHEVPASKTFSAYHETSIRLRNKTIAPHLRLGLRYDFMNERYHLLAPRLAASFRFFERLNLRGAWGLAYKAPAMIQLYPGPAYFDYTNLSYYATDPAERLAIVSTYVYDASNSHLKPSHTNTFEVGADWNAPWLDVRLTAYHKVLSNGVSLSPELLLLEKQNYEVVEKPAGQPPVVSPIEGDVDILVREKYVMQNNMEEITDGIELVVIPPRIEKTRTEFDFRGSYMRTRQIDHGYRMELSKYVVGDSKARYGVYEYPDYITYLSSGRLTVIQHFPALRLIFTLGAELNFVNYMEPVGGSIYPYAYYDAGAVYHSIPEADRTSDAYADLRLEESTYEITDRKPFYTNFHLQVRKETRGGHSFSLYAHNFLWYNPTYSYKERRRQLNDTVNFGFSMSFIIGGRK